MILISNKGASFFVLENNIRNSNTSRNYKYMNNKLLLPNKTEIHVFTTDKITPHIYGYNNDYALVLYNPQQTRIYGEPAPTLYSFVSDYTINHSYIHVDIEDTDIIQDLEKISKSSSYSSIETYLLQQLQFYHLIANTVRYANALIYRLGYIHFPEHVYNSINALFDNKNKLFLNKIATLLLATHYKRVNNILRKNNIQQVNKPYQFLGSMIEQLSISFTTKQIIVKKSYEQLVKTDTVYTVIDQSEWLGKTYQIFTEDLESCPSYVFILYWYDNNTIKQLLQILDTIYTTLHLPLTIYKTQRNYDMLNTYEWYLKFVAYLYITVKFAYERQRNNKEVVLIQYMPGFEQLYAGYPTEVYTDTVFTLPLPILVQIAFKIFELINKSKFPKTSDKLRGSDSCSYCSIVKELYIQTVLNAKIVELLRLLSAVDSEETVFEDLDIHLLYHYMINTQNNSFYSRYVHYEGNVDDIQVNGLYRNTNITRQLFANRHLRNVMHYFVDCDRLKDIFIIESLDYLGGRRLNIDTLLINPKRHEFRDYARKNKDQLLVLADAYLIEGVYRDALFNEVCGIVSPSLIPVTLKVER